jgi:hypothetical protein
MCRNGPFYAAPQHLPYFHEQFLYADQADYKNFFHPAFGKFTRGEQDGKIRRALTL